MRARVVRVVVIEVGVCVEVENTQIGILTSKSLYDGIGDRMVTSEADRR